MGFSDLPGDVLLCIADQFDHYQDINSLAGSYRFAYRTLNPYLYRRAKNFIVFLSSHDGRDATLRRALVEGITAHGRTVAQGQTPLLLAIQQRHASTVKILLQADGIDVHAKDSLNGWDALVWAVNIGRVDILTTLLGATTYDGDALGGALVHAASVGFKEGFDILYKRKDIDLNMRNTDGNTALICSMALDCCMDIAKVLIRDEKVNLNCEATSDKETPLSYFASKGNTEMVEYLLLFRDRIDIFHVDVFHRTALHKAVERKSVPTCKLLLEACPDLINIADQVGRTPLTIALQHEHWLYCHGWTNCGALVNALVDHGKIDWEHKDLEGRTVLLHAASANITVTSSDTFIFKRLLKLAGDKHLSDRDYSGNTSLLRAARAGNHRIAQLLVQTKAVDPEQKNNAGETALMIAAGSECKQTVRVLLATKKININAHDNAGFTPLIHAVRRFRVETVGLLLEVPGIDVNQRDTLGWTPLIWTQSKECMDHRDRDRRKKVAKMLISHGAVKEKKFFGLKGAWRWPENLYTPNNSRRDLRERI
ncbi:hypothetical protein FQN53_000292 [Emmonsiellopsis sp. PD_33]|nr:hypothetical protein FQN53_000292 [Emmonsiellopsis sp. PD_33]KAK2782268.1 hypothetical protein FQN51_004659 [Onygenales sp. PD_10]